MKSNKYLKLIPLLVIFVVGVLLISGCAPNIEKLENKQDIEGLVKALDYKNLGIRISASDALVRLGEPAIEPLINSLRDEDVDVRIRAAEALGKLGDSQQ
jgi:HEAT repeat protein